MKYLQILPFLILPFCAFSQKVITPGSPELNTSYLSQGDKEWEIWHDAGTEQSWTKAGTWRANYTLSQGKYTYVLTVVDTTGNAVSKEINVMNSKTLHAFSNYYEDPASKVDVQFGDSIIGYQYNKTLAKKTPIKGVPQKTFFYGKDLEFVLQCLPLGVGYKAVIPVFNPYSKNDLFYNMTIIDVQSYDYQSRKTGLHKSYLVKVKEEGTNAFIPYVIDKESHRIWQYDFPIGNNQSLVYCDNEIDYQPIKNKFDKETALRSISKGNSVILGTAYARDHFKKGIKLFNTNQAQYAPKGTIVSLLLNSPYIEEWKSLNKKIKKENKIPEVPIDPEVSACIRTVQVYDDKGHFEFTNLMPGEYIIMTTFGYTHNYKYSYYAGSSNLVHPSGAILSSQPIYNSVNASKGATANIEKIVSIQKDGEKVETTLKDVR